MEEGKGGGGGGAGAGAGAGAESARASSSFASVGGRQRFTVELRPGETTIVSWKKLAKDASKVGGGPTTSVPEKPPANAHPAVIESRLAPGQPAEDEVKDAPPASRFSAVIEKIERLYMGKHSSDEEDLNDVPDDDEYDTEDSFIDDAELDEYFQVDNSAIKHDGFFVNRGKLERINDTTALPNQQPKKRRRKDVGEGHGEGGDGRVPNKHVKVGKKAAGKSVPLIDKNITVPSHIMALPSVHHVGMKFQNHMNSSVIYAKNKNAEPKTSFDPTPSKVSNGDASLPLAVEKDIDKTGLDPSKYQGNKLKDGGEASGASVQRSRDKSSYAKCKSPSGKLSNSGVELDQSVKWREKDNIRERSDLNVSEGKYSSKTSKAPLMQRKECSSNRPKSTMLEKAIRELEKMVADSRPPAMEAQDADISSQAVKRRLPHEVKQKLAKVARLAQASHGKISKELINRLMSILGHFMQLRTLKRNLKDMVNMGLSAKKEHEDRFQQMKKEVTELIRVRVPYIMSKVLEQKAGASDDFQDIGSEEKEVIKGKCMDDVLENKICDLYDLYVDGLDEDAGPQVRKLYAELAQLWPDGFMDNRGIKHAICRAKDRKRSLYNRQKDQEKIKRKKLLIPKTEETVLVETNSVAQPQYTQEKSVADSNNHGSTSLSGAMPNATAANTTVRMPSTTLVNGPNLEWPKQEKAKGSSSNPTDTRTVDALTKKKVKRKPDSGLDEAHFRAQKLASAHGEERHKPRKQDADPFQKPSLPLVAAAPPQKQSLPLVSAAPLPPTTECEKPS